MVSISGEDGVDGSALSANDGLGFDIKVFKQYLQSLLPPGEQTCL